MRGATQKDPGGGRGPEANCKTAYQHWKSYPLADAVGNAAAHNQNVRQRRQALRKAWHESSPIAHATDAIPVTHYLRWHGLGEIAWQMPDDLRLHPGTPCYTKGEERAHVADYPAMLAVVRDPGGQPVTLHRTYLTQGGEQAPVSEPRKLMAAPDSVVTKGAAIRLYPAGPTLAVAQGIESALAVRLATGLPVWAVLDADGLRDLEVPEGIEKLAIYADHDAASINAARELALRMDSEGQRGRIVMPANGGQP